MTEEELFQIKQKFLREIPHPKLISKHIDRLAEVQSDSRELIALETGLELKMYLEKYLQDTLALKLRIANAASAKILRSELLSLYRVQLGLIQKLYQYYPQNAAYEDDHIKQSEAFDVHALIKELNREKISENQINNYLYQQFNEAPESYSELTKAILRAAKIQNHGR